MGRASTNVHTHPATTLQGGQEIPANFVIIRVYTTIDVSLTLLGLNDALIDTQCSTYRVVCTTDVANSIQSSNFNLSNCLLGIIEGFKCYWHIAKFTYLQAYKLL